MVPSEAVLDTGAKQHVFLALGKGRFLPREVKLGVEGNDGLREVLSGLEGGEEVVTSAQFLLDSESRFREAIQMMLAPAATPGPGPGRGAARRAARRRRCPRGTNTEGRLGSSARRYTAQVTLNWEGLGL